MSLMSLDAAAEVLDCTPRHVRDLIADGELRAVDVARHGQRPGKTIGADGREYATRKQRLRVDAASIQEFISRRTIGQTTVSRRRRRQPSDVIQFFT